MVLTRILTASYSTPTIENKNHSDGSGCFSNLSMWIAQQKAKTNLDEVVTDLCERGLMNVPAKQILSRKLVCQQPTNTLNERPSTEHTAISDAEVSKLTKGRCG